MALKTFTTADGSANQALVTNGSGVLSFAAVGASAGQVIQVLSATDSTDRNTNSTSFVTANNTLSVTITPSSTANKIFIIATFNIYADAGEQGTYTIYRDSTNLGNGTAGMVFYASGGFYTGAAASYLDSPSTTSAITYQVYFRRPSASQLAYINANSAKGSLTCMEIKG